MDELSALINHLRIIEQHITRAEVCALKLWVLTPSTSDNGAGAPYLTQGCRCCINRGTVCDSCDDFSNVEYKPGD